VTLFFLQLFQTITTNGDAAFGHNLTGGPNGILRIDPFHIGSTTWSCSTRGSSLSRTFYVALGLFAVVFVALRLVNQSRTGRAWRSQREEEDHARLPGIAQQLEQRLRQRSRDDARLAPRAPEDDHV